MPKSKDHQYTPLLTDSEATSGSEDSKEELTDHDSARAPHTVTISRRARSLLFAVIGVQALIILVLLSGLLWAKSLNATREPARSMNHYPQTVYSPAQDAIENVSKVFNMGFLDRTVYQGRPSPEVDEAWTDLYNAFGLSKIPKEQARLIPNKTLPIPGDEDNYAVGLAVFHQLHCLNLMRKGLWADHYRDPVTGVIADIPPEDWLDHISHCVDNIRQALILVVWQWDEEEQRALVAMNTVHSCRNYDRIVDWAKAHRRTTHFNANVHVEDDIEIPPMM
ncbi:hypothetical protein EIP91_009151 [Steccherinum ochraceum]|uniref:Tat pathway signal sequence n=1 Tax=Steccherinum ochraceum TaxID=92696 RepID=A0A4R0RBT1_9APHY|nr:hypothetical protein EIP91_009151 [Steccherinum ochraceum]